MDESLHTQMKNNEEEHTRLPLPLYFCLFHLISSQPSSETGRIISLRRIAAFTLLPPVWGKCPLRSHYTQFLPLTEHCPHCICLPAVPLVNFDFFKVWGKKEGGSGGGLWSQGARLSWNHSLATCPVASRTCLTALGLSFLICEWGYWWYIPSNCFECWRIMYVKCLAQDLALVARTRNSPHEWRRKREVCSQACWLRIPFPLYPVPWPESHELNSGHCPLS